MDKYWLQPPLVAAPNPWDRSKTVAYEVSPTYVRTLFAGNRLTQIYWLWTHVVGQLPPIPNISWLHSRPVVPSLTTLADSVACFRGVQRPYDDEETGDSVLLYVLNPAVSIARDVNLVCLAKAARVPSNTCLTVQVRPSVALQSQKSALNGGVTRSFDTVEPEAVHGVVTRLELISGDGGTPILPKRFGERYVERLW